MNIKFVALFSSLFIHALIVGVYFSTVESKDKLVASRAKASSVSLSMFESAEHAPVGPVVPPPVPHEPQPTIKPKPKPAPKPKPKPKPEPIKKKPVNKPELEKKNPKPLVQKPVPPNALQAEPVLSEPKAVAIQQPTQTVVAKNPEGLSDADRQGMEDAYKNAVRQAILKHRVYPRQARRKRQEGAAVVAFRLQKNGMIENLRIVTSSGFKLLDKAALQAVSKVQQFNPFPIKVDREYWDFEIPVSFKLS